MIKQLVKLAEYFEAHDMPKYAGLVDGIIKAIAEDKLDETSSDTNNIEE